MPHHRSRYFPTPTKKQVTTYYSNEQYLTFARDLSERCWKHYEGRRGGGGGTRTAGGGGAVQQRYGTLYCGALAPLSYLRLRLALHPLMSTTFSSADTDFGGATGGGRDTLLRQSLAVTESALSQTPSFPCFTLLEGRHVGALVVQSAILHAMGRMEESKAAAQRVIDMGRRDINAMLEESECEVLYGRTGYLQAILFLRKHISDSTLGKNNVVPSVLRSVIETGMNTAATMKKRRSTISRPGAETLPLLWHWNGTFYLGAAHGVVGILHTLLSFPSELGEMGDNVMTLVRSTLDKLDDLCFPSGNLACVMGEENDEDLLVHWCHGAPGHVLLLVKAFEVWNDPKYLRRAEEIARNVILPRGLLRKGVGLCHGISGNAYCFLAVYRGRKLEKQRNQEHKEGAVADADTSGHVTEDRDDDDEEWVQWARMFANFAIEKLPELERVPDRPYSMYEGMTGLALLLLDLTVPDESRFPCYEF